MEIVLQHDDEGRPVDIIFLDFQKAFDTVPHMRLLEKMKAHGFGNKILIWIQKWLTGSGRVGWGDSPLKIGNPP